MKRASLPDEEAPVAAEARDPAMVTATVSLDSASPRSPSSPPFEPRRDTEARVVADGALLAERYRIGKQLGRGGMGEVYEAQDEVLDQRVALKTLRYERLARAGAIEAMKRELALARSVTHPNVARVFDFAFHGVAGAGGLAFLTMELLEGVPLSEVIHERGPLEVETALAIATDLADALAALHDVGIVHRDFKASNVMLVAHRAGKRAIVTDFGLATRTDADGAGEKSLSGTPAYMAPEQVRGEAATTASDLYALGIVLFEMLAGKRPFEESTAEETARARLDRPAPDVSAKRPGIPRDARRLVRDLLAREPTNRPASAKATAERLRAIRQTSFGPKRIAVWAGAIVLGLGAATASVSLVRGTKTVAARAEAPMFVLAPLTATQGDPRVATTLTELLSEDMRSGDAVRSPAPGARAAMTATLALKREPSREEIRHVREVTMADVVATGRVGVQGEDVSLEVTLFDAVTGATITSETVKGKASDLTTLTKSGAERIRSALGRASSGGSDPRAGRLVPTDPQAGADYASGLEHLRAFHYAEAIAAFERTVARAPDFAPANAALAQAYLALGRDADAVTAANRARDGAKSLPRADELAVYALAAQSKKAWSEAVMHYQALAHFYPDRTDHVSALGRALVNAGKPAEGMRVLAEALERPHGAWDDVQLNLALSYASGRAAKDAESMRAAERAAEGARKLGAEVLLADANLAKVDVLLRENKFAESLALLDQAETTYAAVGDRSSLAGCDAHRARIHLSRGELDRALELAQRALDHARAFGNRYLIAHKLMARGIVEAVSSKHVLATETFAEAQAAYALVGDREGVAHGIVNRVVTDAEIGRFTDIDARLAEARKLFEEVGMTRGVGEVALAAGVALERQGHVDEAVPHVDRAIGIIGEAGDVGLMAEARLARARIAVWRMEPDVERHVEEAAKVVASAGDPRLQAELAIVRARKAMRTGDAAGAAREANEAAEKARESHVPDVIASAEGMVLAASRSSGANVDAGLGAGRAFVEVAERLDAAEPKVVVLLGAAAAFDAIREPGREGERRRLFTRARTLARENHLALRGWEVDIREAEIAPSGAASERAERARVAARKLGVRFFDR